MTRGINWLKATNVKWVQSHEGWNRADVMKALEDAKAGRSYHDEKPALSEIRG